MFKNLKDKVASEAKKTSQLLFSTDSTSGSNDSGIRTYSITSRDENHDNHRSRLNSNSSDISQINSAYATPTRLFKPPSDIESDLGDSEVDQEPNNKMQRFKQKFTQLKNAYDEIERERDLIKNLLQQNQDTSMKRQSEINSQHEKDIKSRDHQIEELTHLLSVQINLVHLNQDELRNLREKNTKLETSLNISEKAVETHQEKQVYIMIERDKLLEQLNEKQAFIESIMKDRQPQGASAEVKEHFDSDISVLLHDKERLLEELESKRSYIQQLETNLELTKQVQIQVKTELDDLLNKFDEKAFNTLKIDYENLTNQFQQTKQEKDNIQLLLDETNKQQTMYKDKYEQIQQQEHTDDEITQIKAAMTKLQHDYDESLANSCQTLDTQRQQHLEEIARLTSQQQTDFDKNLNELQKENDRLKSEIEKFKTESENTRQEELSVLEDELKAAAKRAQDTIINLTSQVDERQEEINRLEQLLNEQTNKSNQFEEESNITKKRLQDQLDEKTTHIENISKQLEEKQNEITRIITDIDQLKLTNNEHEQIRQTMEISQNNDKQLLEQKDKIIENLKQDHQTQIENLNKDHQQIIEELNSDLTKHKTTINEKQEEIDNLSTNKTKLDQQYSELEIKFNQIFSEKAALDNELDKTHLQMQSTLNEQKIKELENECDSYRNEIETLKTEIISLININEENTRRIDEFDNAKYSFEQEINEKDRQITECNEKIQEIELNLKRSQESGAKLRQALQKTKESRSGNEQINPQDAEKLAEEYEQKLKEQEKDYDTKLKLMAKQMSAQIEEKEHNFNQQLIDFIENNSKTEDDGIYKAEQRANNAEQRAYIIEEQMSKLHEQLKEKQLDHYRVVQDLQDQIQKLAKQYPKTTESSSQTITENDNHLVFEPTEVDYLKQIVLAYMTGTDRITMVKVICAVLRYTEDQTSLIIEHEKLRQARWLNSTR